MKDIDLYKIKDFQGNGIAGNGFDGNGNNSQMEKFQLTNDELKELMKDFIQEG